MAKNIVLIITLIASSNLFAAEFSSTINSVYTFGDSKFIITLKDDNPTCTNTGNPKYYYVQLNQNGVTEDGINRLLSTALTAATTGKTVSIIYDETASQCFIGRIWLQF